MHIFKFFCTNLTKLSQIFNCSTQIIIYGDPGKNVVGVMLHKFKGVIHPPQKNMFRCLTDILNCNNNEDFGYPVLQVVPMKTLLGKLLLAEIH